MTRVPLSFAVLLRAGPTPLVAVLGSGLDPAADLAPGTRIFAARSFVDARPGDDPRGVGTAAALAVVETFRRPWSEVHLVVAQVAGPSGTPRRDALLHAMRWVRTVAEDLHLPPASAPPGVTPRLAARGVFLLPLAPAPAAALCHAA